MKAISISVLKTSSPPIVFLLRPGATAADILRALKLKDLVLFPISDPAKLFGHDDEVYSRVSNGDRLYAALLAEASEFYRRSRAYH
jgi:hypothetical protein